MHLHDLTSVPATDPVDLYRMRDGLYAADMLLTALVHFDLFSWLNTHPATRAEICQAFEIVDRPADVMLTLLAAMGHVLDDQPAIAFGGAQAIVRLGRGFAAGSDPRKDGMAVGY